MQVHNIPTDAQRAKVRSSRRNHNHIRITGWGEDVPTTTRNTDDDFSQWMIQDTQNAQHEKWIATRIKQQDHIMLVSDGSYHPDMKKGTAAWVMTTKSNTSKRL